MLIGRTIDIKFLNKLKFLLLINFIKMDKKDLVFSLELNEIIQEAEERAIKNSLEVISLESVQKLIIDRYLNDSGKDEYLQKLFETKVGNDSQKKEYLFSVATSALSKADAKSPRIMYYGTENKPRFSDDLSRILERVAVTNDIVMGAVGSASAGCKVDTATFYIAMFLEKTDVTSALKTMGLDGAAFLEIKAGDFMKNLDSGIDMDSTPEDKKSSDDDSEEARFESAGRKEAISTRKPKANSTTPTIDEFGIDMTENAADGKYDPVIGRDKEVSQIIEILSCRKKCNAILLGEAGTGKSALVEGLAQRIANGNVPRDLKNKKIVSISTTDLTAGTQYRGQLEERVMNLCNELRDNREYIIYLDEFHSATSENSTSIADMLKPSLSRGEITVIASTTLDEYKKYIEKDGALKRRFQKVFISEPNREETYKILKGLAKKYQEFHHVRYTDEALHACAEYSERYMYDRKSPDRAIDVMDTAGAQTKLSNPGNTEELDRLEKERDEVTKKKIKAIDKSDFSEAKAQRDEETRLNKEIEALKKKAATADSKTWPEVTIECVASVISKISGVAVDKIITPEMDKIRGMRDELKKSVIGQDEAIDSVVKVLSKSFLGLRNENRPVASLLFTGPSGVGKTLIAEKIAETVFGSKDAMLRVDCGELSQEASITKLIGASASYVGYNDTALLEKVRDRSQILVLFDEIEKCNQNTINTIFLNMMDNGMIKLANGKDVSFRDAIIIFTSNEGTKDLELKGNGIGFGEPSKEERRTSDKATVMKALEKKFRPEFRGRLTGVTVFNSLGEPEMMKIFDLELNKFKERLKRKGYSLTVGKELKKYIVSKTDTRYGARDLTKGIGTYIEDKIVERLLDPTTDLTKKKIKANLVSDEVEITLE